MHLPSVIERFVCGGKIANFVSVRPNLSFHAVSARADGGVEEIKPVMETDLRINGGFFLFRREIFDYMRPGEELVQEPFERLIRAGQLRTHAHDGFTASMDTFKDKQHFDELYSKGTAPWEVWRAPVGNGEVGAEELHLVPAMPSLPAVPDPLAVKYPGDFLSMPGRRASELVTSPRQP